MPRPQSPPKPPPKQAIKKVGDIALEKGLPANETAERALLGAILLTPASYAKVAAIIEPEDHSLVRHRLIHEAIKALHERGVAADTVTLCEELMRRGQLEAVDGASYIASLTDGLPEIAAPENYAAIVREAAIERRVIQLSASYAKRLLLRTGNVRELLAEAGSAFFDLQHRIDSDSKTIFTPQEVIETEGMDAVFRPWQSNPGIPTGFPTLDEHLSGGLIPGFVTTIAAETSSGKTALAGNIALNLATGGHPVGYFTSEMSKINMLHRFAAARCGVSYTQFRRGWLRDDALMSFTRAITAVSQLPILLDETTPINIHEFTVRATRMVRDRGVKVVILDYIQLMDLKRSGDGLIFRDDREALTYISGVFVKMAKTLKIPVIFLSQFSRAKRGRDKSDRGPKLSDLFGASALENNSAVALALWRPEFDRPGVEELRNTGDLIILKNRNGSRSTIRLDFKPGPMVFTERIPDVQANS